MRLFRAGVSLMVGALALVSCGKVRTDPDQEVDAPFLDAKSIDAAPDASPDAPPDAPSPAKYDIAYIKDFTFAPSISSISNFVVVINKGTLPLKLSTIVVTNVIDDNAQLVWSFAQSGTSTTMLNPRRAAGALSPLATTKLIDSGVVPEPRDDQSLSFFMSFQNSPTTAYDLSASLTLTIDNKALSVPFVIHIVPGGATSFNNVARISAP
jgi:hypothetical protein